MTKRDTYYALVDIDGNVALPVTFGKSYPGSEKCVVLLQDKYDAMQKELEAYRAKPSGWKAMYKGREQAVEELRAERDAMQKELEEYKSKANYSTHTILKPKDCNCGDLRNYPCPVCDCGLSFCTVCKGGEAELEEQSCDKGKS